MRCSDGGDDDDDVWVCMKGCSPPPSSSSSSLFPLSGHEVAGGSSVLSDLIMFTVQREKGMNEGLEDKETDRRTKRSKPTSRKKMEKRGGGIVQTGCIIIQLSKKPITIK